MIAVDDLRTLARARLEDANVLFSSGRNEGAAYICGYAVELALKARICENLNWEEYPGTRREFEGYASFRTHNLTVLLRLSGQESRIKTEHLYEWSAVSTWDPEARYKPLGHAQPFNVAVMIISAEALLKVL